MKIGDKLADVLPMQVSRLAVPRKADAWHAQLERAWLESWRSDGSDGAGTPAPDESPAACPPLAAQSDRLEPAIRSELDPFGLAAHLPEQHMPICGQPDGGSFAVAWGGRPHAVPGSDKLDSVGRSGNRPAAASLPLQGLLATALSLGPGHSARPAGAQAQHHAASDHSPDARPARTLLQVTMTDGVAQVTLRDAGLTSGEAARIPQAIAHQLLESGLASVRLYVNGRLSQFGRHDRSSLKQDTHPDIGSTDLLHINPLERK